MIILFLRLTFALCLTLSVGVGAAKAVGKANHGLLLAFNANDEAQETALYLFDIDRQIRIRLVASSLYPSGMDWSNDGVMAFTSLQGDVFVWDENGIRNLTNTPDVSEYPSVQWSPDGQYLVCGAVVSGTNSYQVYVIDYANPARSINVSNNEVRNAFATWSPDGQWLAFKSFTRTNVTPSGFLNIVSPLSGEILVSELSVRNLDGVTWSPDSTQLAFVGEYRFEHGFYLLDIATGNVSEIPIPLTNITEVRWSPQSSWLVLTRYNRITEKSELYLFNLQTSELRLISDPTQESRNPRWSLDGQWLVFDAWVNTNFDIHLMNIESGEIRNITQSTIGESNPQFVP